ncbi:MAG: hypothetical protein V1674_02295 [Candidatus Omnitrophota bacterium]
MKKILALCLALFVFVSICFAQEVNKARVITDKIRYKRAQEIEIIITNNFSQEIWFGSGFAVPFTTIHIENKTNKGWQEIYPSVPAPTSRPSPSEWIQRNAKKLLPNEKIETIWNQQIAQYRGGDGRQVNSGKYRVKFEYYTFNLEQAKLWTSVTSWKEADKFKGIVYSKEFEILTAPNLKKTLNKDNI